MPIQRSNRIRVSYRAWPALPQSDALYRRHMQRRARIRHRPGHAPRAGAQAAVKAYIFSMPNVLRSSEFTPLPISAAAYHTGPGPHCPNQMRSVTGTCSAAPEYGIAPVTRRAPGHKQPSKRISILCQTCSGPANSRPCPSAPPRICPTAPGASLDLRHPA